LNQPIAARRPSIGRRVFKWSPAIALLVATTSQLALRAWRSWAAFWAGGLATKRLSGGRAGGGGIAAIGGLFFGRHERGLKALTELERASNVTEHVVRSPLRERVASQLKDAKMVLQLDQVRMIAVTLADGDFDFTSADAAYRAAFTDFGIPIDQLAAADAARIVQQQAIREELADALTSWSIVRKRMRSGSRPGGSGLLEIARQADPDFWRNQLRQAFESPGLTHDELTELAIAAPEDELSPSTLLLLIQACSARHITDSRVQTKLRQVQRLHSSDFWINFALARFFEHRAAATGRVRSVLHGSFEPAARCGGCSQQPGRDVAETRQAAGSDR
jgi:hypothetical protein